MILFVATKNAHKCTEIRDILADTKARIFTMGDFPGAPAVIEDSETFEGNALKKALHFSRWVTSNPRMLSTTSAKGIEPMFALADDSGLEVDALQGAPGVHSARFASLDTGVAGNSPDIANNAKLLKLLKDVPPERRKARFRCVLALSPVAGEDKVKRVTYAVGDWLEKNTVVFEGTCEGVIQLAQSGLRGFGYDPLFVPAGYKQTFGDLPDETKNKISHRAQALHKLKDYLRKLRS